MGSAPGQAEQGRQDQTEQALLSIVMPLLNEQNQLAAVFASLVEQVEAAGIPTEFVFVDDGSSDGTWSEICRLGQLDSRVRGLALSRNFGKESAVFAGIGEARGQAVIVIDGDGQHPPAMVPRMYAAWRDGAEIVEAVKTSRPGQSLPVRLASRLFNRTFSRLTGVNLVNATDFRLLSRRAVDALLAMPERVVFFRGLSAWIGFRRVQLPFDPVPRSGGESRFTLFSLARFATKSLISFTSAPLHLVTLAGVLFAMFAFVLGLQTLWTWFSGEAVAGFTTVILLMLVQGSVMMIALGVIGQYLAQIHNEVKQRPRFIIGKRTGQD